MLLHVDSEDWSDWVDAQADLSLRWAHKSFCLFCRASAHISEGQFGLKFCHCALNLYVTIRYTTNSLESKPVSMYLSKPCYVESKMHRLYRKRSLKEQFGVQPWSVLYPKPRYNKPCCKEVQVYFPSGILQDLITQKEMTEAELKVGGILISILV